MNFVCTLQKKLSFCGENVIHIVQVQTLLSRFENRLKSNLPQKKLMI